jgi:hypothetical protein
MIQSFDESINFYLITLSFHSSCMTDSITNRIYLFKTIRIVIFLSICWLRVESFYDHSIEIISFIFTDFQDRREINEFENQRHDADEIRSKWQRDSKMTWSEEKIFVTNKDLDSQRDLDKSWDKEISRWDFLYNEINFSSRLERQQLAIHSFVSQ